MPNFGSFCIRLAWVSFDPRGSLLTAPKGQPIRSGFLTATLAATREDATCPDDEDDDEDGDLDLLLEVADGRVFEQRRDRQLRAVAPNE